MILEYIDMITLSAITAHVGLELGIPEEISSTALAYLVVMMEQMSDSRLEEDVAALAEQLTDLGALDVYVLPGGAAASLIDAREQSFWVAKANNADDIVDIVVPRASLPDFMDRVAAIAASEPSSAIPPSSFCVARSSTSGSSTMMIMPKTDSTISGRIRMYSAP